MEVVQILQLTVSLLLAPIWINIRQLQGDVKLLQEKEQANAIQIARILGKIDATNYNINGSTIT